MAFIYSTCAQESINVVHCQRKNILTVKLLTNLRHMMQDVQVI